jgi:four helix bundle protein
MGSNFNSLVAYRLAAELADDLCDVVARMPAFDRASTGMQLARAVDSVAANIAESTGRWTKADKRRFLEMARGSLCATEHWVTTAYRRQLIDSDFADRLEKLATALDGLAGSPLCAAPGS